MIVGFTRNTPIEYSLPAMNWLYKRKAAFDKRFFPEKARQWRRWKQHEPESLAAVDHAPWAAFLARHIRKAEDGSSRVAYARVDQADRRRLDGYIAACGATPISVFARDEQFAFWANLYNALTVRLVLDHYPLRSIKRIGLLPTWLGGGPWNRKLVAVEGVSLSLNDIEHRVLRRNWRDPLIHYAVNCGSLGCPDLRSAPFTGASLRAELDDAARSFVDHPRGVRFAGERLIVCSIYMWFIDDFGGTEAGVIEHLARHASPQLRERLGQAGRVGGHQYDWRLNDADAA